MYINALNNLLVINFSHVKKYNVQNFTYRSHQPPHLPPSGFSNWNGVQCTELYLQISPTSSLTPKWFFQLEWKKKIVIVGEKRSPLS